MLRDRSAGAQPGGVLKGAGGGGGGGTVKAQASLNLILAPPLATADVAER